MPQTPSGDSPQTVIKLSYYDEKGGIRSYETEARSVVVGSHPDCHLVLPGVPSQACRIYLSRQGYYAMDLGGTLTIDGKPGSGFLAHGAVLQLGPSTGLRFQIRTTAAAPTAPPRPEPAVPAPASATEPATPTASPVTQRPAPSPAPRAAGPAGASPWTARAHHPGVALTLGILLPGAGQAYNGQPLKAALLVLVSALVIPWLYSLYDAWSRANRIKESGGRQGSGGWSWVIMHLWFLLVAGLLTLIALTLLGVLS
jgi:TM2 domain-containing membrane protein YozV